MPHHSNKLDLPPKENEHDDSPRMIGFEMEFSGNSRDETATVVHSALGGELQSESSADRVIQTDSFGKCIIELDWAFLKRKASGTDRGEEGAASGLSS